MCTVWSDSECVSVSGSLVQGDIVIVLKTYKNTSATYSNKFICHDLFSRHGYVTVVQYHIQEDIFEEIT